MSTLHCDACGADYGIGQSPYCKDGHAPVTRSYAPNFAPYFDIGLGAHVEAPDQRRRLMKQHHLDYRDHPSNGDLSARRDRIEQQKRERASVDDVLEPPNSVTVDGVTTVLYDYRERPLRRQIGFCR